MSDEQKLSFISSCMSAIERIGNKDCATAEELQAMAAVARVLLDFTTQWYSA